MNVLVTGGSGFIGRNIVKVLKEKGNKVGSLDIKEKNSVADYHITCDIRNRHMVEKALKGIDQVFHLAAITSPPEFGNLMADGYDVNVLGTYNILAGSQVNKVQRVVIASSSSVYGNSSRMTSEGELPKVYENFYPLTKRINEMTAELFEDYNLEVVTLRYFNTYGADENSKGAYSSVIWKFLEYIRNNKKPVIYGDGKQSRDFVYVKDAAIGSALAMDKGEPAEAYNIGSGHSTDFNTIFEIVKRETGYQGEAEYVKNPFKSYQQFTLADLSKSKRVLNYTPQYDIRTGIRETLESI